MSSMSEAVTHGIKQYLPDLYLPSGDVNAKAVRYYRKMHHLNQEQLGELLGISRRTLSHIEIGRRRASRRTEEALYFFVMRTRDLIEEHGVIPPDLRWERLYQQDSGEGVRKQYIKEMYIELDQRVIALKAENRKLRAEIEEKDQHIRNLMKHRVKDISGLERDFDQQIEAMRREMDDLKEQIRSVA